MVSSFHIYTVLVSSKVTSTFGATVTFVVTEDWESKIIFFHTPKEKINDFSLVVETII